MRTQNLLWAVTVAFILSSGTPAGDVVGNGTKITHRSDDDVAPGDVVGNGKNLRFHDPLLTEFEKFRSSLERVNRGRLDAKALVTLDHMRDLAANIRVQSFPVGEQAALHESLDPYWAATSRYGDDTIWFEAPMIKVLTSTQIAEVLTYHLSFLAGESKPEAVRDLVSVINGK